MGAQRKRTWVGFASAAVLLCVFVALRWPCPGRPSGTEAAVEKPAAVIATTSGIPVQDDNVVQSREAPEASLVQTWRITARDASTLTPLTDLDVHFGEGAEPVARTDRAGGCVVPAIHTEVTVSGGGYQPARAVRRAMESVITIDLEPGATVRGRVVDQDGKPLVGANLQLSVGDLIGARSGATTADRFDATDRVSIIPVSSGSATSFLTRARSGQNGEFVFRGLPVGRHMLECALHGYIQSSARGLASAEVLQVARVGDQRTDVEMLRVYVGAVAFDGCSNWPASSVLHLTRRTFKAPQGLKLIAEAAVGAASAEVRRRLGALGVPTFRFFATAQRSAGVGDAVAGQCAIDYFGQGRQLLDFQVIALDRFDERTISRAACNVLATPRSVLVVSPLQLTAHSVAPPGFVFEPISVDGANQLFLLPDGQYRLVPKVDMLLRSTRAQAIVIDGDSTMPVVTSVFDGASHLEVSAATESGASVHAGSFMISGHRREVMLSVAEASRSSLPCEAGTYEVTYRDSAGRARATASVVVGEAAVEKRCVLVK